MEDLALARNRSWSRDLFAGFLFAAIPLLFCGVVLIMSAVYSPQPIISWLALAKIIPTSIAHRD